MTHITINRMDDGFELKAAGHAEKDPNEDGNLCCAAVSMLMQAVLYAVWDMAESGKLKEFDYKKESGELYIMAKAYETNEFLGHLDGIRHVLEAGIKLIEDKYPGRIIRGEK